MKLCTICKLLKSTDQGYLFTADSMSQSSARPCGTVVSHCTAVTYYLLTADLHAHRLSDHQALEVQSSTPGPGSLSVYAGN